MSSMPTLIFICTENSARSLMAQAIARSQYANRFEVFSAGSQPTYPDLRALDAIKRHGLSSEGLASKPLSAFEETEFDYAIVLCSKARQECQKALKARHILAWDFPDPKETGTAKAYDTTLNELSERLKMFVLLYDKSQHNNAIKVATDMSPVEFFKLLADETRLFSLLLIAQEGELCVCELMSALSESQPKISRHLAMLRSARVLLDRRQGQWVFYRLNPELPQWARDTLEQTRAQNSGLLTPLLNNLCAMGERPERAKACCA